MRLSYIDNRWVAVQVHAGRELKTAQSIRYRGYEEFVPTYEKRSERDDGKVADRALFDGYVFVRFHTANAYPLVLIPGVVRLVGVRERPIPIEDAEIQALQTAVRAMRRCAPCGFISPGQEIEVQHGPLRGIRGKLVRWKSKHKLIISVSLLRQSISVELDPCEIAPVVNQLFNVGSVLAVAS